MRSFDITQITAIANRPDVRPSLGGEGALDFSEATNNPRNYLFEGGTGGFFVHNRIGTRYEVHSVFTPERIGVKDIVHLMYRAQDFMFSATDCTELITRVPDGNTGAKWLAKKGNFTIVGRQENWAPGRGADVMVFHLDTWASLCSTHTQLAGALHDQLHRAREAKALPPVSSGGGAQSRILGVALHLVLSGNVAKGVDLYNNWAALFGHRPFAIISFQPPVIDIGDAIVGVEEQEIRVMLCR